MKWNVSCFAGMVWIFLETGKKAGKYQQALKCDRWTITCIITAVRGVCFHFVDKILENSTIKKH